jgi:hypothetical protein
MTDDRTEHDLPGERHVPAGKVRRRRRLWRVGLPVALAAAAGTVLLVIYLGRGTGIPAIKNGKTPSAEARKLKFTFDADLKKNHLQWKWPPVRTEWKEEFWLPMEQLPRSTIEHIQALIEERFFSDPNRWDEAFAGVNFGNFNQRCGASVLIHALSDGSGNYTTDAYLFQIIIGHKDTGPMKVGAAFLAGSDGRILHEWDLRSVMEGGELVRRDPDLGCEAWEAPDGWHIVIRDETLGTVDANGRTTRNQDVEYLYRPGAAKLIQVQESPPK